MMRWAVDGEDPDRLYTVTGGRSRAERVDLDLVTLILSEANPAPGMQSEHVKILRMCRNPTAVVEVASALGLPVSVVKILLSDLLQAGRVSARHPSSLGSAQIPDAALLKEVLSGLQKL
jgi:hypothetical protein